jgi:type III restriction enzyme
MQQPGTRNIWEPDPAHGWITDEAGYRRLLEDNRIWWPPNPVTGKPLFDEAGKIRETVRLADLLPGADGKPKPSLVNMLRLRRPILKAAEMVKLPLRVSTRHPSQRDQLLAEAITLRVDLEKLAVSEERTINLKTLLYEPGWLYEGGFRFKKHYFGPKPGELKEATPSGALTEEFQCAQFLDNRPEVRFWVRNLARRTTSFRLQTSQDWFYPDFPALLVDGRVLAVEYKGKHLYDAADAGEKRAVGAVWESRSAGRCLFVMPTAGDFATIAVKIRP